MKNPFFVMMFNQHGTLVMPLVNAIDDVEMFATEEEARSVAEKHPYCKAFGYEVFEAGTGN